MKTLLTMLLLITTLSASTVQVQLNKELDKCADAGKQKVSCIDYAYKYVKKAKLSPTSARNSLFLCATACIDPVKYHNSLR